MAYPPEADFAGLIARLAEELDRRRLPFMLIGGQAVLVHGEPRLTQDVDVTLGAAPERLDDVLAVCTALELRPLPSDAEQFVRETFVLPAGDPVTGIRVDFLFSSTAYEAQAIDRATRITVGGVAVPFATAEDLILHKLFAARPRDLEDAAGIARRQGDALDWSYITGWARDFSQLEGRERMLDQAERLRHGLEP